MIPRHAKLNLAAPMIPTMMAFSITTTSYNARNGVGGISRAGAGPHRAEPASRPRTTPRIGGRAAKHASGSISYLQPDPLLSLNPSLVGVLEPYTYAKAAPLELSDPTGLYYCPTCEPTCPDLDDIQKRIDEVVGKIATLRATKSCSSARPGTAGRPLAATGLYGPPMYSPALGGLSPCIQCCVEAQENKHREMAALGINWSTVYASVGGCWMVEVVGYEAELFCLIDLEAGYNWQ